MLIKTDDRSPKQAIADQYICAICYGTDFVSVKRYNMPGEIYLTCSKCFFAEPKSVSTLESVAEDVHKLKESIEYLREAVKLLTIERSQNG